MVVYGLDRELVSRFDPFLAQGERLVWVGVPNPFAILSRWDMIVLPASLVWTGVFFYMYFIADTTDESGESTFPAFFVIPFVVLAVYGTVGRFVFKWWRNGRTAFALTDRRVMVLIRLPFTSRFRSLSLAELGGIELEVRGGGNGSITFGSQPHKANWFSNTGLNPFQETKELPLAFVDIKDVQKVNDLIARHRGALESQMSTKGSP